MADLSEFNAIKLVKSLVARLEKGEHEGEETKEAFRADLDRYIAYEDEQVCQNQSGKLRQGPDDQSTAHGADASRAALACVALECRGAAA